MLLERHSVEPENSQVSKLTLQTMNETAKNIVEETKQNEKPPVVLSLKERPLIPKLNMDKLRIKFKNG